MGAGHCQWGGFTDRNVCNIHGEEIRPLGSLPASGGRVTHGRKEGWKEGRKARKYIRMIF